MVRDRDTGYLYDFAPIEVARMNSVMIIFRLQQSARCRLRRPLEQIFTQRRIIGETCSASERLAALIFPVQQLQQMPASCPVWLVTDNAAVRNLFKRG